MKKIFILSAIVYLILGSISYHPDTKLTLLYPSLNSGKIWNIYKYLEENKLSIPDFHYPPLHFWVLKVQYGISHMFGGSDFDKWLAMDSTEAVKVDNIYFFNFLSKSVLLVLALLAGYLIYKIAGKTASVIWLFNPITLYSIVLMGQNDILAIFPFLLGLLAYFNFPILAFLLFGIGSSIKVFPLIWSVLLAMCYPTKSIFKKIIYVSVPVMTYLLTLMPFLKFDYFRKAVLFSGLSERMLISAVDIGFGEKILIVPILLVVLALVSFRNKINIKRVCLILTVSCFVIFGFSHFHPQWLVWVMPFWAIYYSMSKNKMVQKILFLGLLISFLIIVIFFNDKFLTYGIFSPINPSLLNLPTLNEKLVDISLPVNIAHSIIAGISVWWLVKIVKKK